MPLRLLILEDDDGIRTALRMALEDEGYLVADYADGEEALQAVREEPVDLMLVDLMLGRHGRLHVHPPRPAAQRGTGHRGQRPRRHRTTSSRRSRPAPTTT